MDHTLTSETPTEATTRDVRPTRGTREYRAVTVALFGLAPRFTPVAWGVLVGFIAVYLLGSLANSPHWLLDLDPFSHVPRVGSGGFTAIPLVWLLVLDAALIIVGTLAFRRRDLR